MVVVVAVCVVVFVAVVLVVCVVVVIVGPRNLTLQFGQNWVSNCFHAGVVSFRIWSKLAQ